MYRAGRAAVVGVVALVAGVVVGTAHAGTILATQVATTGVAKRTCLTRETGARGGLVVEQLHVQRAAWISARLVARSGNWDLALVDKATGRTVAGSAHFGARELAEGVVDNPTTLQVQACRLAGPSTTAKITVALSKPAPAPKIDVVRVSTPTPEARARLESLGFERGEHPTLTYTDIYVRPGDRLEKLALAGLIARTLVSDAATKERTARRIERRNAIAAPTGLPSQRTGPYRRLMNYSSEMTALATAHPTLVKRFTLPLTTYEGRPLEGIEVTENVADRDGKPVFLLVGAHHAREWPSAEHALEWAYELVSGYVGAGTYASPSPRVVQLMKTVRTIIVPVVNPDGFNASREFGEIYGHSGGHDPVLTSDEILAYANEYRRKNCRINEAPSPAGSCGGPAFGLGSTGVDLNRNYGAFWGGPGSGSDPVGETYRGPHCPGDNPVKAAGCGPFSEPETEDIRRLIASRHVTTLITNHTYASLVLRAPGLKSQGLAPDEPAMKALGDRMACENGYQSQYGWQLYDTTGTTEDWSYETTGGYGYTFEIGPDADDNGNFHTAFANHVIAEYEGTTPLADSAKPVCSKTDGLGNREAYFIAMENTANTAHHSVITGSAPAGAVLRLKKTVETETSIRAPDSSFRTFTDVLESTMVVPPSGSFTWHINPSTRPPATVNQGRPATGVSSAPITFSGSPAGADPLPDPNAPAGPCGAAAANNAACYNDHGFTVPGGVSVDNALASIQVEWTTPGSDWDMRIYRDTNGDGLSAGEPQITQSEQGTTASEATSVGEPDMTPGKYVIRMINFAATEPYHGTITFYGPHPFVPAHTESWTLTCEQPEGTVKSTFELVIARGAQKSLSNLCSAGPTVVEVADFSARRTSAGVAVTWRTASERAVAGYNVWRGGTKLNRALIRAKHTTGGARYTLVDRTARPGRRYTYRLQLVRPDGTRAWGGGRVVTVR